MVIIQLEFLAGRYHATQWGRNVNEGEPEWPPAPYRLARALVDVWKRRYRDWPEERVLAVLEILSGRALFSLPPALPAHTRSYLSSNKRDPSEKQLIFDAFVAVTHDAKTLIGFEADPSPEVLRDLDTLLKELNYLGRSESWVQAKVTDLSPAPDWNCVALSDDKAFNGGETVRVAFLLPPAEYQKSARRRARYAWLEALCLTTTDLLREGWSSPPALWWADYHLKAHTQRRATVRSAVRLQSRFRFAKYALSSTVLPSIRETVPFAERIRAHLMGIHKQIRNGDPALVSPLFSGKEPDGTPLQEHRHSFYLPLDEDGDGRLDHLLVSSAEPFDSSELSALDRLRSVWQPGGKPDVNFVLVSLSAETHGEKSSRWISATPFVTSRHYRKGRGTYEEWLTGEIKRECAYHGLLSPVSVEWVPATMLHTSRAVRWMEFTRKRKDGSSLRGHGCILTFEEPVSGPFAVGSLCHFGLGVFVPYRHQMKREPGAASDSLGGSRDSNCTEASEKQG